MKIGLIDVDGHNFPNFALMKVSGYYKAKGNHVEWIDPSQQYDEVWSSKVFTFSNDYKQKIDSPIICRGGTGHDIKKKLPDHIESVVDLDYSLYPQYKFSIQFFSRGCIRNCAFCLVRQKEGRIRSVDPVNLNPNGEWIEVLDNNFFANKEWRSAISWLKDKKQPVKFHGVDVRIMNEEQAHALNTLKLKGGIHIAWDNPKDDISLT